MMKVFSTLVGIPVVTLLLMCGCGSKDNLPEVRTVKITGTVKYRGKPLQHPCQLTFAAEAGDSAPFSAVADKGGRYEVEVPPGQLHVTVSVDVDLGVAPDDLAKMSTAEVDALIRKKGGEQFQVPLTFTVTVEDKEGGMLDLDLAKSEQ